MEGGRVNEIELSELSPEVLAKVIRMYSQNLLTVDGLWFRTLEDRLGLETALEYDTEVWRRYGTIEARRIRRVLDITEDGVPALAKALNFQIWTPAMGYEILVVDDRKVIFNITDCTVQRSRLRQGIGEFPCKGVGVALFTEFSKGIDQRFRTKCLVCPPDEHPQDLWCGWEFELEDGGE